MDDLTKSLKAQLYDRVSSPLLSSFLISWSLWNHRFFIVLLSDLKVIEKFAYLDEKLYPGWQEVLGRGFAFPLGSALILLYLYPIPARKVYEHVRAEQKRLKEIQYRIEEEMPISEEEARGLRRDIRNAAESADKQLSHRDSLIKDLKLELAEARKEVAKLSASSPSSTQPEIVVSKLEGRILLALAQRRDMSGVDLETLFDEEENIVIMHALDGLQEKDLIEAPNVYKDGQTSYQLTPTGRDYYLRHVAKLQVLTEV